MDSLPLFDALRPHGKVLLAGAGGGYDIFSGLPLYFALKRRGHQVWLANYSFAELPQGSEVEPGSVLVEVTGESAGPAYFPEKYLCQWLGQHGEEQPLYAFKRCGVQRLREAYRLVLERHGIEAVVLVDGGTDSLMRGDEYSLGTPGEDLTSVAAVDGLDVACKLLTCIGFGVDTFHGVCHHFFLEAVADLTRSGHFLGAFSLLPDHKEALRLKEAADYVFSQMPDHPSIVVSSILSAVLGRFGNHHATSRTRGSELYINPLMALYWTFRLEGVARRCLYLKHLSDTQERGEVTSAILRYRGNVRARPWKDLPV